MLGFARIASPLSQLLLSVCGAIALLFADSVSAGQLELAQRPWAPDSWKKIRPLTVRLWGFGLLLVGVGWLLSGQA